MDRANVARTLIEMQNHIENIVQEAVGSLCSEFNSKDIGSNEKVDAAYNMHKKLATHITVSVLNKTYKAEYDKSKKGLDAHLETMDLDSSVNAGERRILYEDDGFRFTKHRHQNNSALSTADLLIELTKAGVDQDVLDGAVASAMKTKLGKVFYDVEPA